MYAYTVLLIAIVSISAQTLFFKVFSEKCPRDIATYCLFQFLHFGIVTFLLLIANGGVHRLSWITLALGGVFGVLFLCTLLCYIKAIQIGPLSFTALFNSSSMLVTILYGVLFWDERVSVIQCVGLAMLLLTYLIGATARQADNKKPSLKWLLLCLLTMLGNGALGTMSKQQQMLMPGKEVFEYLIICFATAALAALFVLALLLLVKKQKLQRPSAAFYGVVAGAGVTSAVGNWAVMAMTTLLPTVVQYPSTQGGIVILSAVIAAVVFKEKLTPRSVFGLCLGLLSLVLLSL